MTVERVAPQGLFKPAGYSQVTIGRGRRIVFISGQVSIDADGALVAPGDFAGQVRQVYANLRLALAGVGANPANVTKLTIYVVNYEPLQRPVLAEARTSMFGVSGVPASTLVGVTALAEAGYLVEVEAVVVID
jgi:enamine deaminase RidA (YjgF/YER057c/UK114 family)